MNLINLNFDSGVIPGSWLIGIVKPIYKNKCDDKSLDNYRAICLTSNLGKVFTSILNARLNQLSDEIGLITDAQGGFRSGYSAQDNIFVLYLLRQKNYFVHLLIFVKHLIRYGGWDFGKNSFEVILVGKCFILF